jgi:DNA-binding transcriptional regulator YiaG
LKLQGAGTLLHEVLAAAEREHLSQPVFAHYLNVSKNLV